MNPPSKALLQQVSIAEADGTVVATAVINLGANQATCRGFLSRRQAIHMTDYERIQHFRRQILVQLNNQIQPGLEEQLRILLPRKNK